MTTFVELRIGEEFHLNIDADGYEPLYYKIDDGEAYQFAGRGEGTRERFQPDTTVWSMGNVRHISTSVTEIERAALTLIAQHGNGIHPVLTTWKAAIVDDPDEQRDLGSFAWDNREELLSICQAAGFAFPGSKWDRDCHLFGLIWDGTPAGEYTRRDQDANAEYAKAGGDWDRPLLALGHAVIDYRKAGRPAGDQTHTIQGMGAPLLRVSTSLAAAVVEYHEAIKNLIYLEGEEEKSDGTSAG